MTVDLSGWLSRENVWVRGVLSRYLSILEGFVESLYFYRVLSLSAGFKNIYFFLDQ